MIYSICSVCKFADSCDSTKTIDPFCLNYEKRPETNADHIRAMSNEELARWIASVSDCIACQYMHHTPLCNHTNGCESGWLNWLGNTQMEVRNDPCKLDSFYVE